MTYKKLDTLLTGRCANRRKVANNTYAHRLDGDRIAIRLYATDILTFFADGSITVSSGGWRTVTTKARLNAFLPSSNQLYQRSGVWFWTDGREFCDGDTLLADGSLQTHAKPGDAKATQKCIATYAKLCADALPLDKPSLGDCFYCYMQTEGGEPLGDAAKSVEHLLSHMGEGYVVPSLVSRALTEAGNGPATKAAAFGEFDYYLEIARRQVTRAVKRYLRLRLGQAV